MPGQHPADHVFIDLQTEAFGQMLSDSRATKAGIAALELTDGLDQFLSRPFRPRFAPGTRAEEEPVFGFSEQGIEAQQGRGSEDDGGTKEPTRARQRVQKPWISPGSVP